MNVFAASLPVHLVSLANQREHWAVRHKRAKEQRQTAFLMTRAMPIPCTVKICRVAPRELDSDNLAISAKHIRDGIADRLGVNDRDPRVTWVYSQTKGSPHQYAALVTIESEAAG